ncbi:MAG: type II toxin-antitoxin system RelE/ParE family toxin [Pseudomonadales bacterium]|nr:type II toxin-antitoxin system RelE/ParE family toxin [Pseudomonadales bacterium]
MSRINKSDEAEQDLEGIWNYTFKQWGEAQADKYYFELTDAFHSIQENHLIGFPIDYIKRLSYLSLEKTLYNLSNHTQPH